MSRPRAFRSLLLTPALTLATLCVAELSGAGAPEMVRFQGTIQQLAGGGVQDGTYTLRAEIFDVATGGEPLYRQEVQTEVAGGAYTLVLSPSASEALSAGDLEAALQGAPRFLQVTVVTGPRVASEETLLPRQELASAPFALEAADERPPSPDLWSASRTDVLVFNDPSAPVDWRMVPGLELDVELPAPAKLHISADGVQRADSPAGTVSCHQGYRILIDGTPVSPSDPTWGQRIIASRRDGSLWAPWGIEHSTPSALPAGTYTVRVETNGSNSGNGSDGCIVCGGAGTPPGTTPYTSCELAVEAFYG